MEAIDTAKLRGQLLAERVRYEAARAYIAEMEAAKLHDQERDRMVKTGRIRTLPILDPIMPDNAADYVNALEHWARRDPGEDVTIVINSPGGSITHGLAVYDTIMRLRRQGHHVTTHGQGLVASMAGVLLQAGDERIMDARAKLLIHEGSTVMGAGSMTRGESDDLRVFQDMLQEDILDILTERSTLTKAALKKKWSRRDWFLTADEALKYGFVDRVE